MNSMLNLFISQKSGRFLMILSLVFVSMHTIAQDFNIGHRSLVFYDSTRDRNITTEIYYPSISEGEDEPLASGSFPVLVFGHGFVMTWESYENFWTTLVPDGYVICFPTTEMSLLPDHAAFGLDLKFIAAQMQQENNDLASAFYNSIAPRTAIMGHSMGGGASFIAAANNSTINTIVNFAAAETNPSAISAANNVTVPTLMFAGDDDCVTPASEHQDLIYDNLASDCKTLISIINGGHCYFANDNFNCNFGESFCNPTLDITREEQQSTTFDFLKRWLNYSLKDNQDDYTIFSDSLQLSSRINFAQACNTTEVEVLSNPDNFKVFPNPTTDNLNLHLLKANVKGTILIYNLNGERVYQTTIDKNEFQINLSDFPTGTYQVVILNDSNSISYSTKFIKENKN